MIVKYIDRLVEEYNRIAVSKGMPEVDTSLVGADRDALVEAFNNLDDKLKDELRPFIEVFISEYDALRDAWRLEVDEVLQAVLDYVKWSVGYLEDVDFKKIANVLAQYAVFKESDGRVVFRDIVRNVNMYSLEFIVGRLLRDHAVIDLRENTVAVKEYRIPVKRLGGLFYLVSVMNWDVVRLYPRLEKAFKDYFSGDVNVPEPVKSKLANTVYHAVFRRGVEPRDNAFRPSELKLDNVTNRDLYILFTSNGVWFGENTCCGNVGVSVYVDNPPLDEAIRAAIEEYARVREKVNKYLSLASVPRLFEDEIEECKWLMKEGVVEANLPTYQYIGLNIEGRVKLVYDERFRVKLQGDSRPFYIFFAGIHEVLERYGVKYARKTGSKFACECPLEEAIRVIPEIIPDIHRLERVFEKRIKTADPITRLAMFILHDSRATIIPWIEYYGFEAEEMISEIMKGKLPVQLRPVKIGDEYLEDALRKLKMPEEAIKKIEEEVAGYLAVALVEGKVNPEAVGTTRSELYAIAYNYVSKGRRIKTIKELKKKLKSDEYVTM